MTRRLAALVVLLALACGAAAMGGAAATLGVSSRSIDTFTAALPASTSTTSGDSAAPTLVALEMFDTNANGKVDQVKATFNEALAAYTAGTTPWTLANVPSGGTLSAVAVSGSVATLSIAEGGGAADTAVGTFTVALAQSTTGIRDAAGNRSSFTATAPADKASPVLVSVTDSDAGGDTADGRFESADTVDFLFSEPLDTATLGVATVDVLLDDPQGDGNNDYLTIPNLLAAPILVGANHLTGQDLHVAFNTSSVAFRLSNTTIRVSLSTCSGQCSGIGTQNSGVAIPWTFVATLRAPDALSVVGRTTTMRLM